MQGVRVGRHIEFSSIFYEFRMGEVRLTVMGVDRSSWEGQGPTCIMLLKFISNCPVFLFIFITLK